MKRSTVYIALVCSLVLMLTSGCGYFNTFYNAQKQFREAERETRTQAKQAHRQQQQQQQQQSNNPSVPPPQQRGANPPGGAGQSGAATEKYRKVIETSSRLLEEHPQSRWADNALFIMGVSYYRLGDLPRAERKFTELMTLFPKSTLIPEATAWKARTLSEQKKKDEAIELLQTGLQILKPGPEKASALFLMGNLCSDLKRYTDAAGYFRQSARMTQPSADRINALYNFAETEFALDSCEQARDAFATVADETRDVQQAYDASVHCSQCEVRLHNYDKAEVILTRLKSGERFLDYSEDIPLELAELAVQTGRVDDGMKLYQEFIDQHPNGEHRGLAFYRMALIHRDQRVDLPLAKSLLDSSMRSGANKEITDSARVTLEQISKGLLALDKIKTLQETIRSLQAQADSMNILSESLTPTALLAHADSVRRQEAAAKPARKTEVASADTAQVAEQPPKADSVAHAPQQKPSPSLKDSTKKVAASAPQRPGATKPVQPVSPAGIKPARSDPNQTWDLARRTFHSMKPEERISLPTLTRAIETRDSARDEGNNDHTRKVQAVINRAYGVGPTRATSVAESLKVQLPPKVKTSAAESPTRIDSLDKSRATDHAPKIAVDTLSVPAKVDSLVKPSFPDTSKPHGTRHSWRPSRFTPESPGGAPPDSGRRPAGADSVSIRAPLPVPMPSDSNLHRSQRPLEDSIGHVAAKPDSLRRDSTQQEVVPPVRPREDNTVAVPKDNSAESLRTQLLAKERELQLAYLHAAEFYAYSLTEQDSALNYYKLAAASPVNAEVFWRAHLHLGKALSVKADSSTADSVVGEAAEHYRAVLQADSVPIEAANTARTALKLPLIEVPVPEQVSALRAAEVARFSGAAPADSVVGLYSKVIAMDSTSREGKMALFAKATLLEKSLHQSDQARVIYERLLKLNPDSAMAAIARGKLAPPDSGSIFLMSDAQLSGKREAVESLFDQKQDEKGWPPSEESLRGRHFR